MYSLYADLVLHVLAHVAPPERLNASVHDQRYVEFCQEQLGPIEDRELGQDVLVLSGLLKSHAQLAQVQLLAWLFESVADAATWDTFELLRLNTQTTRPDVLAHLRRIDHRAVELLRCAAALERTNWEKLPTAKHEPQVGALVAEMTSIAPYLSSVRVAQCRALGQRGRVYNDSILVGCPGTGAFAPTVEHAALQAAHEASVLEVQSEIRLSFIECERAALTLLRSRAQGSPFEALHAEWLSAHQLDQFGGSDALKVSLLPGPSRGIVKRLLAY